jgi:hypothetical protein
MKTEIDILSERELVIANKKSGNDQVTTSAYQINALIY